MVRIVQERIEIVFGTVGFVVNVDLVIKEEKITTGLARYGPCGFFGVDVFLCVYD